MKSRTNAPKQAANPLRELVQSQWLLATVGEVGDVQVGRQLSPKFKKGVRPIPYIRAANITTEGLDLSDVLEMDFKEEEQQKYMLEDGDVVLAEASGSPKHVGRSAIWRKEIPVCCFQNTVIRFRSQVVIPEFAQIVFRFHGETGEFGKVARGIGILHLGTKRFSNMPFLLPPRKEQERIARRVGIIVGRLDRVRGRLTSALKKVDEHWKRTSSQILCLQEIYPELYPSPNSSNNRAACKSGITIVTLGDVCTATNGRAFKSSEWTNKGIPIIRIQNLKNPDAPFNFFRGKVDPKHLVKQGDLLFAWSGTPETSFGAFLWKGGIAALNQHIFKIEPNSNLVDTGYLYHVLRGLHDWFVSIARGGGGLAHLSKSDFLKTKLALPNLDEQKRRAGLMFDLERWRHNQTATIERSIQRMRDLFVLVLRKAVSGRLVARAPIDEPIDVKLLRQRRHSGDRHRKASRRPQKVATMERFIHPLYEVLASAGPLNAQQLLEATGYRTDAADEVSRFYAELTEGIRNGQIVAYVDSASGKRLLKASGE